MSHKAKSIQIDAWQLGGGVERPVWLLNAIADGTVTISETEDSATIQSDYGTLTAQAHYYLLRNEYGNIYCRRADVFANEYDEDTTE